MPSVLIVLINYNSWNYTILCLESLLKLNYSDFSIIIIENASNDDSYTKINDWAQNDIKPGLDKIPEALHKNVLPFIEKPIVLNQIDEKIIDTTDFECGKIYLYKSEKNSGFSGGNNVALLSSNISNSFDYIWCLNNDTIVDKNSLSEQVKTANENCSEKLIGAAILKLSKPNEIETLGGGILNPFLGTVRYIESGKDVSKINNINESISYIAGTSILFPSKFLRNFGGFDESFFMYSEDAEISKRAIKNGYKLLIATKSYIWHAGGSSSGYKSPFSEYYIQRNSLKYFWKFYPFQFPIMLVISLFAKSLNRLRRRQLSQLRAVFAGTVHFFSGK